MSNNDIKGTPSLASYEGTYPSVPSFCDVSSNLYDRHESFRVGESVKLLNGSTKKVLHVSGQLAQVSGYRWWFPFSELRKAK